MPEIGYEEMLELAHQGAKVLQTRSVELAWVHGLEVRVRHPQSADEGTSIREVPVEARQKVRGIATEDGVAKLTLLDLADRPGMGARLVGMFLGAAFIVMRASRHDLPPSLVLPEPGSVDCCAVLGKSAGVHTAETGPNALRSP